MTELNPETTVYHRPKSRATTDKTPILHTRKHCQYVQRTITVKARKYKYCSDEWDICKQCTGNKDTGDGGIETRKVTELIASEGFGPEDLGLSPVGDTHEG